MYLDPNQSDYLIKQSGHTGKSRAQIVREAINDYRNKGASVQDVVDNYNIEKEAEMKNK